MGNLLSSPTADKIARGYDLNGRVAIVTGASSGIGLETVRVLVRRGARVFLTCRNLSEGNKAKHSILEQIGLRFETSISVMHLDLASLCSVKTFVEEFEKMQLPLHFLVLNAAVMGVPYQLTKEGFEMHFGVNYLGHFYLTQLLVPMIEKRKQEDAMRIVAVCCATSRRTKLKLKSMPKGKRQSYDSYEAYNQSKLALRYFAEELSLRSQGSNIEVVGADPGTTYTWIIKNLNPLILSFMAFASIFMKTPPQGAATVVFACLDRRVSAKARPFCADCKIAQFNLMRCRNPKLRKDLYEMSLELVNTAVFDSCTAQGFDPKTEIWRNMSRMVGSLLKEKRRQFSKGRFAQGAAASKYQKLD